MSKKLSKELLEYFKGDEFAAEVWKDKYAQPGEETPCAMHRRMAKEFARIEFDYTSTIEVNGAKNLSEYGQKLWGTLGELNKSELEERIFQLFDGFKYIIPQGSVMSQLGAKSIGSLSNCFVIGQPEDSYGGIFQKDEEQAQLMKRRGGVGQDISSLRPEGTLTSNAAKSSTGAISFMHRFSNTTEEVAQKGRRGALMLSMHINHPDINDFIKIKRDLTKVTGANISIKISDEFMKAVEADEDYYLRWPCTLDLNKFTKNYYDGPYNELIYIEDHNNDNSISYVKKIKAKEYWKDIIDSAHSSAEPGIMFESNHINYSPDGVYDRFRGMTTNPCFHPDTLIETEYGRLKISEIDKPMRVYSMDSDGKLVMANASASFISKKNAETLKITLKSGSSIIVTPEHKLYVQDIGWVEAKDLKVGNQLGHLCRSRRGAKYSGVHLSTSPNKQKDQVMEHKLVYGNHEVGMNIHHLDRNTYNNSIDNLELLTHSKHSKITATEDNPQIHQVRDETGKFISGPDSKKGAKTIVDLPEDLKTNMLSKFHNMVVSIEIGETIDVYDIQVEDTHCLIANNIVAHNCGEIFMPAYDACRLIAINLFGFVINPFTSNAYFDFTKFYEVVYEALRLSDDLVDLEIESISRIIKKIISDPESPEAKRTEMDLWVNILETASASRRTGLGITGLGDAIAALGLSLSSKEGLEMVESISRFKLKAELDCTTDLSILRDPFEGWDRSKEFDLIASNELVGLNPFYNFIAENFTEEADRMYKYGRRNVSWSTIAPTGSVSSLASTVDSFGVSSGMEPVFMVSHMRRKKVDKSNENIRVDFIDQSGQGWQEYPIVMGAFKDWVDITHPEVVLENLNASEIQTLISKSPWSGNSAPEIPWEKRVAIQSVLQKYVSHSISSTINLPKGISKKVVSDIYTESWKKRLKGITVYVDGSRSGVLLDANNKNDNNGNFEQKDAVKRPKELDAITFKFTSKGNNYTAIVGLLQGKPYEVFLDKSDNKYSSKGTLIKKTKGKYIFKNGGSPIDIISFMSPEEEAITRLVSANLRHGTAIEYVVEQLQKTSGDLFSFTKGLARVLKGFILDGTKSTVMCQNPDCTGDRTQVIFEEGCAKCLDCGSSACN